MSEDEITTNAPAQLLGALSSEERSRLSRVLFPETDTRTVSLLGKERELRPLPVKVAQRLKAALAPLANEIQQGLDRVEKDPKADYDAEDTILRAMEKAALVLSTYYEWEDVQAALTKDGLSLAEYQALAVVQTEVSGSNDFLLGSLRTMVRWMRVAELMSVRFQSMLTGQP